MLTWVPLLCWLTLQVSGLSPGVPAVSGCEQVKFYYQHGAFDSSYVLKDVDSTVLGGGCVDGCVYMKVNGGESEFCFESSPHSYDEATSEYRLPCDRRAFYLRRYIGSYELPPQL